MTSLGRLLPILQRIKLAFVVLLASVSVALKYKGFWQNIPVSTPLFLGFATERAIHMETSPRPDFLWLHLLTPWLNHAAHLGSLDKPDQGWHLAVSPSPTLPTHC